MTSPASTLNWRALSRHIETTTAFLVDPQVHNLSDDASLPVTDGLQDSVAPLADSADPASHRELRAAPELRRRRLTVLFAVFMVVLVLMTGSQWSKFSLASEIFFLLGISLASIGALGRIWSSLYISGHKTAELITAGPYSLCRNPLYFFSAIGMVGIGLATSTIAIPLLMVVFFAFYYPMIIRLEERRLAQIHGPEFLDYCSQIPAFWPGKRHFVESETHLIFPKIIRRNLMDAFWFIAFAAILHVETRLESLYSAVVMMRLW